MRDMEKRLAEEKKRIDEVIAPPELEDRMRNALKKTDSSRRKHTMLWKYIIAALLLFSLIGYNYNALAFYGKKIVGFDDVTSGTLSELNEVGMGQVVNESIALRDGAELTINGLISDENRLIVYYTITDPEGNVVNPNQELFSPNKITGLFTNAQFESSGGKVNLAQTELKGTMNFEPVSAFSKELTLHFTTRVSENKTIEKEISFPYEPNRAMQASIKQTIAQEIEVDGGVLRFNSIIASPTLTVIKGTTNVESIDRVKQPLSQIELIANGDIIAKKGRGIRSSIRGSKFELEFDALPTELETLQLNVQAFVGYEALHKQISLKNNDSTSYLDDDHILKIKDIVVEEQTEVTIMTEEDVLLDEVFIGTNETKIPLETTVNQQYTKTSDGLVKERTLIFASAEQPDTFHIGGIYYMKEYNKIIKLPIE